MSSQFLIQLPWLAYSLLIATLTVWSAILFFRDRCTASTLMLIGGIISAFFGTASQLIWRIAMVINWDMSSKAFQLATQFLTPLSALGSLLFSIGLLLFAKRLLLQSNRVAELEAILQDRDHP